MTPIFHILILASSVVTLVAEPGKDFLRFKNGDTLHGQYQGLDEGPLVKWLSSESNDFINFETRNLRKLSLNNGRSKQQLTSSGLVELNNGDRIPGDIIAMGSDSVSVQTEFAGLLTIPRSHVVKILPNRHGSNVLYAGPFNDQDWSTPKREEAAVETWTYGGAAWYSNSSEVLRLDTKLPDQVSIRFQLSWQAPLNASIGLLSDFRRPQRQPEIRVRRVAAAKDDDEQPNDDEQEEMAEPDDEPPQFVDIIEEGTAGSDANSFGSGYLISVLSSYTRLQRLEFDDKLNAKKHSFPNSGGRLSLSDLFSAEFEIRADRKKGIIALFVDGEFFSEWQDLATPLDETDRYFSISAGGKSRLRISDVVISEWNGMPDSARSMQTEDRDVMLLANGTDRFSGKILTLEEDVFRIESEYGIFQIPADEVTDIQLATDMVAEAPEPSEGQILVSLQPNGLLTLLPKEGLADDLKGEHSLLGDMVVDLNYSYLLEFDPIGTIFDNWDDEF